MNIIKIFSMALLSFVLSGCFFLGERVEVPPAHVAKIMTKDGYKEGTISTSKFRLDPCVVYCDKIVILDSSDKSVSEEMVLFMPEDKLNMGFDLRMTMIVNPNKYDELFSRIPPENITSTYAEISWNRAYATYAQQIIRAEAREFLSNFTIAEIASSREAINAQLSQRLTESINSKTPFQVRYVGLADIQYPKIIVRAQEAAAERREAIQQEEAQLQISRVTLERQLQEQQLQRRVDVERAAAEAEVAKIQSQTLTPEYVRYRELQILEKMAEGSNKIFVPTEMLSSLAGQVALGRQ